MHNKQSCEISHIFTYWLGGKINPAPFKKLMDRKEICEDSSHFKFINVWESPLRWFVGKNFLESSIIGRWNLKKKGKDEKSSIIFKKIEDEIKKVNALRIPKIQIDNPPPGIKERFKDEIDYDIKQKTISPKKVLKDYIKKGLLDLVDGQYKARATEDEVAQFQNAVELLFLRSQIKNIDISEDKILEGSLFEEKYHSISVKLFFTGVLSIIIRWKIECDCSGVEFNENELDCVADLIKGPEQTVRFYEIENAYNESVKTHQESINYYLKRSELGQATDGYGEKVVENKREIRKFESQITDAKKSLGELNVIAAKCAKHTAELFLEEIKTLLKKNLQVTWFSLGILDVNDRKKKNGEKEKLLSIYRLEDWRPGKNKIPEYCNPYVGFIMGDLPIQVCELDNIKKRNIRNIQKESMAITFCQQLITISSTSPYRLRKRYVSPITYVLEHNVARGNALLIVDERCTVVVGLTIANPSTFPLMTTLAFAFECIFASTISVKQFITELERNVPEKNYDFNSYLATEYQEGNFFRFIYDRHLKKLVRKIDVFLKVISAARALSPCDEKLTQIESYVSTRTVIHATTKIKELGLNKLIELARNKMITFSRLVETGYKFVSSKNEEIISRRILWFTIGMFILAITAITLKPNLRTEVQGTDKAVSNPIENHGVEIASERVDNECVLCGSPSDSHGKTVTIEQDGKNFTFCGQDCVNKYEKEHQGKSHKK